MADIPTPATPLALLMQAGQSIPQFQDPAMSDMNARMAGWIEQIRQGRSADDVFRDALHETHGPGHTVAQAPQAAPPAMPPAVPQSGIAPQLPPGQEKLQPSTPSIIDRNALGQSAIDPTYSYGGGGMPQAQSGIAPTGTPASQASMTRHPTGPDMGDTSWMRNPWMTAQTAQSLHGTLNNMYNQTFAAGQRSDIESARQHGKDEAAREKARQFDEVIAQKREAERGRNERADAARRMAIFSAMEKMRQHAKEWAGKYGQKEAELAVAMHKAYLQYGGSLANAKARIAASAVQMEADPRKRQKMLDDAEKMATEADQNLKMQAPEIWREINMPYVPVQEPDTGMGFDEAGPQSDEIRRAIGKVAVPPPEPKDEPAPTVFSGASSSSSTPTPVVPPKAATTVKTPQQKALEGASTTKAPPAGGDVNERKGGATGRVETVKERVERLKREKASKGKKDK